MASDLPINSSAIATRSGPLNGRGTSHDLFGIARTLIRTDFKVRYHGSAAGFFWTMLKPLLMFVTLVVIFSFLFPEKSYALSLIIGLFIWDFFLEGTNTGLMSLFSKGYLATKVKFPSWILILTSSSNALSRLIVFCLVILVYVSISSGWPGFTKIGLLALYMICLWMIVSGFSLAGAVMFLRFRDLNQIWDVVLSAGFFVAPIIYPLDILPEQYHLYLYLWPPTPIIEFSRALLISGEIPTLTGHLLLLVMSLTSFLIGAIIYRSYIHRAIEKL